MFFLIAIAIFIVVCIVCVIYTKIDESKTNVNKTGTANPEQPFVYESDYGGLSPIIRVKYRVPKVKVQFKVEANHNVGVTHVPDRVVYTGATVGGVHTGGFHVEKGGNYATPGLATGTYRIMYKYASMIRGEFISGRVAYLELPDELYKAASMNYKLLRYVVNDEQKQRLWRIFPNLNGINNLLSLDDMSKADAEYVISWLAGEE